MEVALIVLAHPGQDTGRRRQVRVLDSRLLLMQRGDMGIPGLLCVERWYGWSWRWTLVNLLFLPMIWCVLCSPWQNLLSYAG